MTFGFAVSELLIDSVPVAAPAAVGLKLTDTLAVCPAVITFGATSPLAANPAPLTVTPDTVRSAFPVLEIIRFEDPVDPTVTLPRFKDGALTAIWGAAVTAVAVKFTACELLVLLPVTVNVPLTGPAAVGVTPTVIAADCPALIVIGRVIPVRLNCGLETVACEIVTEVVPGFVTVTD